MTDKLTSQRELVLAQKYKMYDTTTQIGDHLDGKASVLLQAGGLIIAITGVVKIPAFVHNPDIWAYLGIIVAFSAFAGMVICAVRAWAPAEFNHAGRSNWDEIFNDYINVDLDTCFNQVLSDLVGAINTSKSRNQQKARYVTWSAWLFAIQIVGVLILALTPTPT